MVKTNEGYMSVLNAIKEFLESLKEEHSREDYEDGLKDALDEMGYSLMKKVK